MAEIVKPYKNADSSKKEQVATMFNNIAPRYDLLNSILSLGIHKGWRKKAIGFLKDRKHATILDIATGTADFAIEALVLNPDKVTGVDISAGMLELGKEKIKQRKLDTKIFLELGDSENLPFAENSFDAVTVAFGVRNFENLKLGLSNIFKVLNPNGTFVVLEFSKPKNVIVKWVYNFYFNNVTPFVGKLLSKDASAYSYLPESVYAFPDGKDFTKIMEELGFKNCKAYSLTFNIANIYVGEK